MKATELAKKSDAELTKVLAERRQELADAMVEYRTKEVKNVKSLSLHKKTIARILGLQRQRQLLVEGDK